MQPQPPIVGKINFSLRENVVILLKAKIMGTDKEYHSLKEFYPYYLSEHEDTRCRVLHFIGTGLVILSFVVFLVTLNWWFLAVIPFLGYGFAWVGHFFFEQNKPATFKYPGYSLASDFILFWHLLIGKQPFSVKQNQQKSL